tara:strand:- start:133 stop:528 length:396 start_codon:yes stop_codon:yes gene_type:complete
MNGKNPLSDEATKIMQYMALAFYDNRCFVTHEKFKERGFVIHHLWYIENDVRRENYPKGDKGRQLYMSDLKEMVERNPDRFILIKNGIHTRIDHPRNGLSRMKPDNFTRLVVAVKMTIKEKRKTNKRSKKK